MEPAQERKNRNGLNKLKTVLNQAWVKLCLLVLFSSVFLFIILSGFFFDFFKVNQADMEDTYFRNDLLLLQKNPLVFKRLEVYQIQFPQKDENQEETRFIQRLIALPGDSLCIRGKVAFRNGLPDSNLLTQKHNYFIKTRNFEPDQVFRNKYGLYEGGKVSTGFDYSYSLRASSKLLMEKDSLVLEIKLKSEKPDMYDPECFPGSSQYNWNADYFGTLYIPKEGDSIRLDSTTLPFFESIICEYDGNELSQNGDSIFINGRYSTHYLIRENYYFFMGDNRDNAVDSRHFGYLPESCIRARVLGRLHSQNP